MMQSLMLHIYVGKDGILKLETPIDFRDAELDVVLVVSPSELTDQDSAPQKGWPPGFFEQTFGSIPDLPARGEQGNYETRESLE